MTARGVDRRVFVGALAAAIADSAAAAPLVKIKAAGRINVALYSDFEPWSWRKDGTMVGIDVDLAELIAREIGVVMNPVEFIADESVDDDLRDVVWKGMKLGGVIADVLMHAPFDHEFAKRNDESAFFAPYHHESFAIACDSRVLDCEADPSVFRDHKVAVVFDSVPDQYMLGSFSGRLHNTVVHKGAGAAAVAALVAGEAPIVMATRAEIERGLVGASPAFKIRRSRIPGLFSTGWDVGVAVKGDSGDLGERISGIMATIIADKRIDAIFARYGVQRVAPKVA